MTQSFGFFCDGSHNQAKKAAVVQEFAQLRKVLKKPMYKSPLSLGPLTITRWLLPENRCLTLPAANY